MSRRHFDHRRVPTGRRSGMTLIELTVVVAVMSLVTVVLGGVVTTVSTAREHVEGFQEATAQGRLAVDRIRDAISRTGIYQLAGEETVAGITMVSTVDGATERPETLVVWTGGREGSFADESRLSRLPIANELLIVTPDPADPRRLVEIVVPTANDDVDFRSSSFPTRIRQLIASAQAEKVTLCDRVRLATTANGAAACVRFNVEATPASSAIEAAGSDLDAWYALPWAGGACSSRSGLQQWFVRIELQVVTVDQPQPNDVSRCLSIFGAAVRRGEHRRGE